MIYYKNKVIMLLYSVGSLNDIQSQNVYKSCEVLFKGLASQSILLNQWSNKHKN